MGAGSPPRQRHAGGRSPSRHIEMDGLQRPRPRGWGEPWTSRCEMSRNALISLATPVALLGMLACGDDDARPSAVPSLSVTETSALAAEVRTLAAGRGIGPIARPPRVRPELVRLGQALA